MLIALLLNFELGVSFDIQRKTLIADSVVRDTLETRIASKIKRQITRCDSTSISIRTDEIQTAV